MSNQELNQVTFGTAIRAPEDIKTTAIQSVIDDIRNGRWKKQIEQIRSTQDDTLAKTIKIGLPYFIYGIFKGKRSNDRLTQMNGVILDYDHLTNINGFKTLVAERLPHVKYAFQSPRDGVKLLIPFDCPITDEHKYRAVFDYLQANTDRLLNNSVVPAQAGIQPVLKETRLPSLSLGPRLREDDTLMREGASPHTPFLCDNTPDPARACFVSYDPDLFENADCVPLEVEKFLAKSEEYQLEQMHRTELEKNLTFRPALTTESPDAKVISAVHYLAKQKLSYADWIKIGMALYHAYGDNGKPLWDCFADNPHFQDSQKELDYRWKSFANAESVGIGSVMHIAGQYGWDDKDDFIAWDAKDAKNGKESHDMNVDKIKPLERGSELVDLFGKPANVELDISKLPAVLRDYLAFTDTVTDAQPGAKLTAFLPCISANIGNRIYMVNNSARIFPHIWGIIIGPSSISRKTTVIKLARQTLEPYEEVLNEMSAEEYLKNTLIMTDVTMSKLLQMLSENPNRLFIQMEVSAWMRQMNRHWNAGMKQALTDLFDGVDKTIANMERTERIKKPAFSIIAASTEGWFFQEMKDAADQQSGFLQRFLFCLIQNVNANEIDLSYREGEETCPELRKYEEMFSAFRTIPNHYKLILEGDAKTLRNEKYKAKFAVISRLKNDVLMSYFARMYDGYFFKFCIIFHLLKHWQELSNAKDTSTCHLDNGCNNIKHSFTNRSVSSETVQQAFALCDYYFENTKPLLDSLAENSKLQNERKLVSILYKTYNGTASHSSLFNRSHLNKREFKDAIESLIERNALSVTTSPAKNQYQAKVYVLSRKILESWQSVSPH